ncbi:MAG: FecCD family ABC transporter permease [Methyloligellaceae bacterium]
MTGTANYVALLSALLAAAALAFAASLVVGPAAIPLGHGFRALFTQDSGTFALIMQEIRLPRALLGLMVGAILGLSGAVLQGYLRNPLAEPGVIGISTSASLGAVIALYTGLSALYPYALPLCALAGAGLAVLVIQALAGRGASTLTLILAGVAVSSFAGAMTSLVLNLSPNPFAALEIVFWLMGSLADRSMVHVQLAAPFIIVSTVLLLSLGRSLDALTLGDQVATTLGINAHRLQFLTIFGTACGVGAATSVSGAIGFVGLVVPHILRPLTGSRPSRLLLASAIGGAVLVLAADVFVRVVFAERELKLGVVTALIGAPFFLWLLMKHRKAIL